MTVHIQQDKIKELIENKNVAISLSFELQKEDILKKYPNAIFSKNDQSLNDYINQLLDLYFPCITIKKTDNCFGREYIKEGLQYLIDKKNPYFVTPTKELYPSIADKFNFKEQGIERSIRYILNKDFMKCDEEIRYETLGIPRDFIPKNFYFLVNLTNYIKTHYIPLIDNNVYFSNIKKQDMFSFIPEKYNISNILDNFEQRKKIQYFLYNYLGHFQHMTTITQQIIIDYIIYCLKNLSNFDPFEITKEFNMKKVVDLDNMWNLSDRCSIEQRLRAIDFANKVAWQERDINISKEIFGDIEESPSVKVYVLKVSEYMKTHNLV